MRCLWISLVFGLVQGLGEWFIGLVCHWKHQTVTIPGVFGKSKEEMLRKFVNEVMVVAYLSVRYYLHVATL